MLLNTSLMSMLGISSRRALLVSPSQLIGADSSSACAQVSPHPPQTTHRLVTGPRTRQTQPIWKPDHLPKTLAPQQQTPEPYPALLGVGDAIQISCALIGEVVEHVAGVPGWLATLGHAKDEVHPCVQLLGSHLQPSTSVHINGQDLSHG